ncbi:prephenate dehydratase [Marinococcus halophilus]|uniref:Prephenate dehydratase n=1 Tax=Marinococcus halophilus TaxID=1371 RepID=A0A510Y621_MARHA|nr:prephenate dehydratase [Marinococcus halophilus]OZT81107.1 prephenate dehydratase [Marinococcus halophilus]GEK58826.1 prephenate dehydratase [Marinococcus halophilus]
MKRVGYLGPRGTFTEMAARVLFDEQLLEPFDTIAEGMKRAEQQEIDLAVVPLENAIEGSVNVTLDYLIHKHELPIIGEVTVPIEQHLLALPENKEHWEQAEFVHSHPHAIAQCHEFLTRWMPETKAQFTNSTSAAAKKLSEGTAGGVVIATRLAAEQYGLEVVKENIHDYTNNHTRFVVLAGSDERTENLSDEKKITERTTMVITLPSDYPGALHQVLAAFSWRKLNLTKIESRPMKTGIGNYFFVMDVEQPEDDVLIPGVIAELEALGFGVRVLGHYPCFELSSTEAKVNSRTTG